jgi:hypothetical protein
MRLRTDQACVRPASGEPTSTSGSCEAAGAAAGAAAEGRMPAAPTRGGPSPGQAQTSPQGCALKPRWLPTGPSGACLHSTSFWQRLRRTNSPSAALPLRHEVTAMRLPRTSAGSLTAGRQPLVYRKPCEHAVSATTRASGQHTAHQRDAGSRPPDEADICRPQRTTACSLPAASQRHRALAAKAAGRC